ncbi:MAG: triose-phosphate isomerase, partial [Bacteroidota bacterium]
AFIRQTIADHMGHELASEVSILYGGSCNENNATELFALKDVDGGLIGGAALKSRSFVNILKHL